ncbi:MAG TPA: EB domain-containing protein [Polyangiaceae bacterium]
MILALWVGASSAVGGCGSHTQEDPPATLPQACRSWQEVACEGFHDCAVKTFGNRYADVDNCVEVRTSDCVERGSAPGSTVTPEQVEVCAQASKARGCDAVVADEFGLSEPDPACTWTGTLAEGEACVGPNQCQSGQCSFYGQEACGTCVTRADLGCLVNSECLPGSLCIDGQCVAAGQLGDSCDFQSFCSPELTCQAGQCARRLKLGEACTNEDSGACAANLWCNQQTGSCELPGLLTGPGDCGVTDSGGEALCPSGSHCYTVAPNTPPQCMPAAAEGDPCLRSGDCGVGLRCYESTCARAHASLCTAPDTTPDATYPATLPNVPQCVAASGATLLTKPKVVLVTFAADSRASALEAFVKALGSSSYWQSVTSEYGVGPLAALSPIHLTDKPASKLADADIRSWLNSELGKGSRLPANDGRTLYMLAYPGGVDITTPAPTFDPSANTPLSHSCSDFGGYHDSFLAADGTPTPYAVIPDCGFAPETETAMAHEAVEATTDPFLNLAVKGLAGVQGYARTDVPHFAWALPSAGSAELADMCEWQPLASYFDSELGGTVQRSWSNQAMAGFHQPCVPARSSAAYFNGVPRADDLVTVQIAGGRMRTRGIALALGQSRTVPVDLLSDAPTDGPWRVSAYELRVWAHQVPGGAPVEPTLGFSFDQQSGVNGDTLQLTITALNQDPNYQAEPFVLVSRRGRDTNVWPAVVAQP